LPTWFATLQRLWQKRQKEMQQLWTTVAADTRRTLQIVKDKTMTKQNLSIRISSEMHNALLEAQKRYRLDSFSAMIRLAFADWLDLESFLLAGNGGRFSDLYRLGRVTLEEAIRLVVTQE